MKALVLFAPLLGHVLGLFSDKFIVKTSLGYVRGEKLKTADGNEGLVFLGLPYAEPPVGDLRFRPSVLFGKPWFEMREAKEYANDCWALGDFGGRKKVNQSEDCLYLNVSQLIKFSFVV